MATPTFRAAASTRVVNYSSDFLLLEYSLISISGCKFPCPVAVFCSQLAISLPIGVRVDGVAPGGEKPQNRRLSASELIKIRAFCASHNAAGNNIDAYHKSTTLFSSLAAYIKVLPVLTRTRVLVKVLGRVLE